MKNQTSFADRAVALHNSGKINLMVDSGAFTNFNTGDTARHVNIKDYCDWLQTYRDSCEKYVALDVPGDAIKSKMNYEKMVSAGLTPMYVLTIHDNDWNYLRQAVELNPNVCVAGGVKSKGKWIAQRIQRTQKFSGGTARIHALGYVLVPTMFQLPLISVDSSSWSAGARYGAVQWFENGRLKSTARHDLLSGRVEIPKSLLKIFDEWQISREDFKKEENWRGAYSIATLCSVIAWRQFQRYAHAHGLQLFLSVSNRSYLDLLLLVEQEYKTLTFKRFKEGI